MMLTETSTPERRLDHTLSDTTAPQSQDKASFTFARGSLTHAFTRTLGNSLGLSIVLTEAAPRDTNL